ncbi:hypothetical protein [Hutsoniella sourekii]|uniref:hypothetical protein n=1 Tax=Hutsoniella sourekii TaxID=87650 RepID=UPI0004877C3B|nr:hypothetical protein [Hutsoniella sourekii]
MKQLLEIRNGLAQTLDDLNSLLGQKENPDQMSLLDDYAIPDEGPTPKLISFDAIQKHLADKARAGYSDQIRELIQSHGVDKLSDVNPEKFPDLWKQVDAIG